MANRSRPARRWSSSRCRRRRGGHDPEKCEAVFRKDHAPNKSLAMSSLPIANAEITQFFHRWLETFSGYVRDVDYASARPLFHPDVLAFGTHNDVIPGIDQWVATQWDNVWPKNTDFRFVLW